MIYEIYRRIKVPLRNANKRASESDDKNVGCSAAGGGVVDKTSLRYDCFEGDSSRSLSTARTCALLIAKAPLTRAKNSPVSGPRPVISNAPHSSDYDYESLLGAGTNLLYCLTCRRASRANDRREEKAKRMFKLHLVRESSLEIYRHREKVTSLVICFLLAITASHNFRGGEIAIIET